MGCCRADVARRLPCLFNVNMMYPAYPALELSNHEVTDFLQGS